MQRQQISLVRDVPPAGLADDDDVPAKVTAATCGDPMMERLIHALLPPAEAGEVLRGFYTEALHATLMKRLASLRGNANAGLERRKPLPLQAWRLKRVYQHVEENLEDRIPLAALAGAAGLSRMHFAAQFRVATGMRPHDYVVRRRIQLAKAALAQADTPIVEVALSVGFQAQAHFTTVFKRIAGVTPHRWRALHGNGSHATH